MLSRILRKLHHLLYLHGVPLSARALGLEAVCRKLERAPPAVVPGLLRRFGASVGDAASFAGGLVLESATGDRDARGDFSNLTVGGHSYVGRGVVLDLADRIEIGEDAVLSSGVMVLTHADCGERAMSRWYPRRRKPVRVGRGAFRPPVYAPGTYTVRVGDPDKGAWRDVRGLRVGEGVVEIPFDD